MPRPRTIPDPEPGQDRNRRGPKRTHGPAGPEAVRRAVLEAAADLFVEHPVGMVTIRAIAEAADVQPALIYRYIGSKDDLLDAVLEDLSVQVADEVVGRPLGQISFEPHSAMGRWTVLLNHYVRSGRDPRAVADHFNPVQALSAVIQDNYGQEDLAARIRGAQIAASALGWRLFETYLLSAGDLADVPVQELRDELTAMHRRLGATPWPSPRDPPIRTGRRAARADRQPD